MAHFSAQLTDRARRYADGATFTEIAAVSGVTPSAAQQSVVRFIARVTRIAAHYGDRETLAAMRGASTRDRTRQALAFLQERQPIYSEKRRAAWVALEEERRAAFESALEELARAADEDAAKPTPR